MLPERGENLLGGKTARTVSFEVIKPAIAPTTHTVSGSIDAGTCKDLPPLALTLSGRA
jgi:hypothetical protein